MSPGAPQSRLTYAEYLALEAQSPVRHEFVNGEVFEMAGGKPAHGALAAALARDLGAALRGKPSRVFSSDVRVFVRETGLATYPDLSVVCGSLETAEEDKDAIVNPVLLAEVLSPSTEAWDRGGKAAHYRRIPALREILLVTPEGRLEVQRRSDRGVWELVEARVGERLELMSLGVVLDVAELFRDPLASAPSELQRLAQGPGKLTPER
jgi:Uma2 family endonuclease